MSTTYANYRRADFQEREPQPEHPIDGMQRELFEAVEYGVRELADFIIPELAEAEVGDLRPEAGKALKTAPVPGVHQYGVPTDANQQQLVNEAMTRINQIYGQN